MRVAFMGASQFGLRCLDRARVMAGCRIVGAVTAPQKFRISYRPEGVENVLYADVGGYCVEHGIPCAKIAEGMKDPSLFDTVAAWQPDAFLVAGWYHMVPRNWRELAPAYGLHASLLPDFSGGAPLVWAMIHGAKETGITFFRFDDGVDSGPILGQTRTAIRGEDTIATLYARIEGLGLDLISEYLPALASGTAVLKPQDENGRRVFPQRGPEDGLIDWSQPAGKVHDFVRAQTRPYPGAFTTWQGRRLTIWSSQPAGMFNGDDLTQGQVTKVAGSVRVRAKGGDLEIRDASYDGGELGTRELGELLEQGGILGR